MDMIQNEDIPAAVRMDWIKDRLNRLWVWKQKEENAGFTGIWEVTITIKHKAPEVMEWVIASDERDMDNKAEEVTVLDWDKTDA
jgi:hypothetical protein